MSKRKPIATKIPKVTVMPTPVNQAVLEAAITQHLAIASALDRAGAAAFAAAITLNAFNNTVIEKWKDEPAFRRTARRRNKFSGSKGLRP